MVCAGSYLAGAICLLVLQVFMEEAWAGLKLHKPTSGSACLSARHTIGPVAGAVLSIITTIRDWIAVTVIAEAIGPPDSRPSTHDQLVWVATVLRAVTGWRGY